MEIVNHGPFPHLVFESRSPDDAPFAVVVVRGTFVMSDGAALRPIPEQDPVRLVDVHRGVPGRSSLRAENDLAPFKPRTDIVLDAVARAPAALPLAEWPVRVRVGALVKDLIVCGPYVWQHTRLDGWRASAPVPVAEVPITYELAYGGPDDPRNPVGIGAIDENTPRDAQIAGAQIAAPGIVRSLDARQLPEGLGPIAPSWMPRRARAGTFDDAWRRERWPCLPADFDYTFYNAAHPSLVTPAFLRGDEPIELVNLTRASIRTRLPGYRMFGLGWGRGKIVPIDLPLDTVAIDVSSPDASEHRVHLTWRGCVPLAHALGLFEIRMTQSPRRASSRPPEMSHG
jgi:hypothetical protein